MNVKCNICNLVEKMVMVRNEKEVVYYCPKCKSISKITIEEEKKIIEENKINELNNNE